MSTIFSAGKATSEDIQKSLDKKWERRLPVSDEEREILEKSKVVAQTEMEKLKSQTAQKAQAAADMLDPSKLQEFDEDGVSLMQRQIGCKINIKGYRILLKAPVFPEKTKGGLYLAHGQDGVNEYDVGLVLSMGSEAFKDTSTFPDGPRCKVGDWVDFTPFDKQRKKFNGHLCFVINDDRVNATIDIEDVPAVIPELR
jgi:co-chaperonin GroES (HSP10)